MKSIARSLLLIITACNFGYFVANAQNNVGIGLNSGINARLHVAKPDSGLVIFQNTSPSADSAKTRLYFMNGTAYTGAIGTHITNGNSGLTPYSRMGFFTYASNNGNQLLERLSITDGGDVGIGTVIPSARLEVAGITKTTGLTVTNSASIFNITNINSFVSTGSVEFKSGLKFSGGTPGLNKVLTSDALGNAGWQNASLPLPYSASVNYAGMALQITNTNAAQGYYGAIDVTGAIGLKAKSNLTNGTAIYGEAAATGGGGVTGQTRTSGSYFTGLPNVGVKGITTADFGMQAISTTGTALYAISYNAAGTAALFDATAGGIALSTNGSIKLTGIGEGLNKVLTSNASGNATWEAPSGTGIGFLARSSASVAVTGGVEKNVTSYLEEFDDGGNNFNPATGVYTVPAFGKYQFIVNLHFSNAASPSKFVDIHLFRNGSLAKSFTFIVPETTSGSGYDVQATCLLNLNTGEQWALSLVNSVTSTLVGGNTTDPTSFAAYKIY